MSMENKNIIEQFQENLNISSIKPHSNDQEKKTSLLNLNNLSNKCISQKNETDNDLPSTSQTKYKHDVTNTASVCIPTKTIQRDTNLNDYEAKELDPINHIITLPKIDFEQESEEEYEQESDEEFEQEFMDIHEILKDEPQHEPQDEPETVNPSEIPNDEPQDNVVAEIIENNEITTHNVNNEILSSITPDIPYIIAIKDDINEIDVSDLEPFYLLLDDDEYSNDFQNFKTSLENLK